MKFVLGKGQKKFIPKMVDAMTYEEAKTMLLNHQVWARSESPRYAAAVEVAIKSLEAWDEVLAFINKQIINRPFRDYESTLESRTYEHVKAFIVQKLKEEKYRWHDLRIVPGDLPKEDEEVIVCDDFGNQHIAWRYMGYWASLGANLGDSVIAWREIEPFEEVEE